MFLKAKGLKDLKRNKNDFLISTNNIYLSCPEKDDNDSESESTMNSPLKKINNTVKLIHKKIGHKIVAITSKFSNKSPYKKKNDNIVVNLGKFYYEESKKHSSHTQAYQYKAPKLINNFILDEDDNLAATKEKSDIFELRERSISSILSKLEGHKKKDLSDSN
jgi:hypothetical protein